MSTFIGIDLADNANADTAAIQAALDSAAGQNTLWYFPDGTYNISDSLVPKLDDGLVKRTIIQGESTAGTVFKVFDNATAFGNVSSPSPV